MSVVKGRVRNAGSRWTPEGGGDVVDGYSLIDEPWILVRAKGGGTDEVSLVELFRRSPDLIEIVGDLPTQAFAIFRVTLAVLHRAVDGPRDE